MKTNNLLVLLFALLLFSCGSGTGPSASNSGTTATTTRTITPLTATPSTVSSGGTSIISATVQDSGVNVADGTTVTFAVSSSSLGSITSSSTTVSGIATATFSASSTTAGAPVITATSGSATNTVTVTVSSPSAGSIVFTSASPNVVGIKGGGQAETSTVIFTVKDINDNNIADGTGVDFCLQGPTGGRLPTSGGEYINEMDSVTESFTDANSNGCFDTGESYTDGNSNGVYDSPVHATVSTVSGVASVTLHSGAVAGPVIITARITSTALATSSTPISIGGGVPNDAHLTIVTDTFVLDGLAFANIQANISVFMADRFGNFNVLEGTAVSFYSESGAIDRSAVTDSTGSASVVFRTQNPVPEDVPVLGSACAGGTPTSVAAAVATSHDTDWEFCLNAYVSQTIGAGGYAISTTNNPRDGWATVMVSTRGEEAFNDVNGNGIYDVATDSYTATPQEAFLDVDDDNARDDGTVVANGPFEEFIDDNGDGSYDGTDTAWDSDKTISKDLHLIITGPPFYVKTNPASISITTNGGSQQFKVLISDINLNTLLEGTAVSITADEGEIKGTAAHVFPSEFRRGPVELTFILEDNDTDTTAEASTISIDVTYKSVVYSTLITGTID